MEEFKMSDQSHLEDLAIKLKGIAGKVILPWEGKKLEQLAEVEIDQYPKLWQWMIYVCY